MSHYNKRMSREAQLEFLNLWQFLIVIADIFISVGSVLKIKIDTKVGKLDCCRKTAKGLKHR